MQSVSSSPSASESIAPPIRKAIAATDFSDSGEQAVRHACGLVRPGGEVRIVHVCLPPNAGVNPVIASEVYFDSSLDTARLKAEAEEKLKTLAASLAAGEGFAVTTEALVRDNTAAAICEAADAFGADVICLGARGHSRLAAVLLGSVVQSVLHRSHRPVLVVPRRRQ